MDVHVAVRLVHTLGMGVLLGGAVLVASLRDPAPASRAYEWAFWVAMGVQVLTGVGNLGAVGDPGPATTWGTLLTWKLALVLLLLVASALRLLARPRLKAPALRWAYGGTALLLAIIGGLAVVLAHG